MELIMISRRNVNKLLVASSLLPAPLAQLFAATDVRVASIKKPVHLVFESRASDYGWQEELPADVFEAVYFINGDVTRVWYDELHPLWLQKTTLTAGLTRESEFFVMKTLAKDYDYMVVKEMPVGELQLVSWLLAPSY